MSIEPSFMTATSTGRPRYRPVSGSRKPEANTSALSAVPSAFIDTYMISAPVGLVRFHEPCEATKAPPWYLAGNILPA